MSKTSLKNSLRNKTKQSSRNKNSGGFKGKNIFDFGDVPVKFYKLKEGKNKIDILPFIVKTEKLPNLSPIGEGDYLLDIWVHKNVGVAGDNFLCLNKNWGKSCPICEEREILLKDENVEEEITNALKPKRRVVYNILDLNDDNEEIQILEGPHYWWENEILEEAQTKDEIIIFSDLEEGATVTFRGKESTYNGSKPFIKPKKIGLEERDPYNEEILDETFSLDEFLVIPTYEEIKASFLEEEINEDVEEEEIEKEPKKRKRKKEINEDVEKEPKKRKRKKEINEDVEEEIEEEEIEKESKNKCPYAHVFGEDCDEKEDCENCDSTLWEKCADLQDELD